MTQRDEVIRLTRLHSYALYVEIVIEVKKTLSLIFGRRSSVYTRHIWLQIIQCKSCLMYFEIRIFLVTSKKSLAFSDNINWLILLEVQIRNSRLYNRLYWKWGNVNILIDLLIVRFNSICKLMYKMQNCIVTIRLNLYIR